MQQLLQMQMIMKDQRKLDENGEISLETRFKLSAKTFRHTAAYDALIADYLSKQAGEEITQKINTNI